jgi:hypothetical protein
MRAISGFHEKVLNKLAHEAGKVFEKLEMLKTFEERKKLELELDLIQKELLAATHCGGRSTSSSANTPPRSQDLRLP